MGNSLCNDVSPVDGAVLLPIPPQKLSYTSKALSFYVSLK